VRSRCTAAKDQPRQWTVRPQAQHEAIQAARQRQEPETFKAQYALRAGGESSISQGVRRFDLRRSRYSGLARTHLPQTSNATAMNLVRLADWFRKGKVDQLKEVEMLRPLRLFLGLSGINQQSQHSAAVVDHPRANDAITLKPLIYVDARD
jgi:Transposase DDE domain